MSTITNLDKLKINYLTQEQYDTAAENNELNENELYFTPGSTEESSIDAIEDLIDEKIPINVSDLINDTGFITGIPYGICETEADTVEKTVTVLPSITLTAGTLIAVKFTYSNSIASATLNVNSLGAKSLMRYGTTTISTSTATSWPAGSVVLLHYDGTSWIIDNFNNTTYSSMSVAEYQNGTGTTARTITPARLKGAIEYHSTNKTSTSVTISVADWNATTTCTKSVTGVTSSNDVIVTPAPTSISDWSSGGLYCSAQGSDTLTFTCEQTPTASITVNVLIFD